MSEGQPKNAELQRVWDANAAFWDEYVSVDGNNFHRILIAPAQLRLLALRADERVVELACGNGQFSREMARAGARVIATDFSTVFLNRAKVHASRASLDIECRTCDATNEVEMLNLAQAGTVDAMVCTMAIHDISTLEPMMRAARTLLRIGGRFVCSVQHPCFNSVNPTFVSETTDTDGDVSTSYALKISRYLDQQPVRGIGILGQPEPHWYFPRTLTEFLTPCFEAGLVLDGVEEPACPGAEGAPDKPFSWTNFPSIPPVLVVRLRKPK